MAVQAIRRRRPAAPAWVASLVLLVSASGVLVAAGTPSGAQDDADPRVREPEPRVREYEGRARSYNVRTESLDGVERQEETPEERTVIFDADVLFEFDSDQLDSEARSRLDSVVGDLEGLGPREVAISGHTDSEGRDAYNQDLSERRAGSVRSALADQLGDDFTFDAQGLGETEPVAENETEEGRAQNRRVEIRFSTD